MRSLAKLVVFLPVWTLSAGCQQLVQPPPPAPPVATTRPALVSEDVLAKVGLEYYWRFSLKLNAGERIDQVYRLDQNYYCVTSQRRLVAVDARQGIPKWAYTIRQKGETIFRPVHGDRVSLRDERDGLLDMLHPEDAEEVDPAPQFEAVMINTVSSLVVLDRTTGRHVRTIELGFAANASGATDGLNFYVGSSKGNYYAVRMDAEVEPWSMSTDDMITAPVEYYDGVVYVGSNDKSMCAAVGQLYRKLLWRRDFPAPIVTQFHVEKRGCFVGTLNGEIVILNRVTGEKLKIPDEKTKDLKDWGPFICNGQLRDPIQVSRNTIFQRARKDKFYAISIRTCNLRWTNPHGRMVLAVIAPNVYLLDKNRTLLIVDEATGKIKASVPMGGWELFVPNTGLGAIYAASTDGMLSCIRPKGSGHLTVNMLNPRVTTKPAKPKEK